MLSGQHCFKSVRRNRIDKLPTTGKEEKVHSMAIAIYEERTFTNRETGEIVKYPFYGITAEVDGEYMELPLKGLNAAEKIAFRMIATGENPATTQTSTRKASEEELKDFLGNTRRVDADDSKIDLESDD